MMKDCVILNGQNINVGPWDYQIQQVEVGENDPPTYEDVITNPLPEGATTEQRDMEYDPDRGWYEVGTVPTPNIEERTQLVENWILEQILGGL
jgi:hypothetical protein